MSQQSKNIFSIAEHLVSISFAEGQKNDMSLLPAFEKFRIDESADDVILNVKIDDTLLPVDKEKRTRIRNFESGNGDIVVDRLPDGGYQIIVKDMKHKECALLIANPDFSECRCALNGNYDMRCYGLNSAMMMAYAFATNPRQTLLIHASLVRHKGYGYAFNARSGTGKSTQVSLWLRHIPDCDLMNDDNPVIRIIDGKAYIYGSPWSGKTPCYRNVKAPLGAITRIERAKFNEVERLNTLNAVTSLLPSCSTMKWDKIKYDNTLNTLKAIIETSNVFTLRCLPNKDAAIVCNKAIACQ